MSKMKSVSETIEEEDGVHLHQSQGPKGAVLGNTSQSLLKVANPPAVGSMRLDSCNE